MRAHCDGAFQSVLPELQASINSLKKLTKGQMSEIKSVKKPSKAILTLMTGVCIIMGVEPKMVKREGAYAEYDEDWWTAATSSKVLGNTQLQDILTSFDPAKLDMGIMERLQECTSDEEFNLTNITRASKAAQGKSPRPKF